MINKKKLRSNIGLAYSAKKIVLGTDNIVEEMKKNNIHLILLSNQASFNTQKSIQNKARYYNCQVILIIEDNMDILSNALGNKKVFVLGIKDKGFRKIILNTIKE